jgi:nitroimidazol reductase NimA-like FMN-containing flavoprotein (pyridoxamine 5'-phosphate oxidase superfamily)
LDWYKNIKLAIEAYQFDVYCNSTVLLKPKEKLMSNTEMLQSTERSKVQRRPRLGHHDRQIVNQILDESLVVHVGFIVDNQPFVIPMGYGRDGDRLLLHGSSASRMLQNLERGIDICVTATLLDGIVIARSLFHHEMNYRSVVLFGRATLVEGEDEKMHALKVLSEQIIPGRWEQARKPTSLEVKGTSVLSFPIEEGSAKIRSGEPHDNAEDYALTFWAGQLPLQ